jgi:hypothetical protein
MRQTIIDYGDIRLWNVQTNSIDQEQVFDHSDTDVSHSKITIHVTGYIREGAATFGLRSGTVETDSGDTPPTATAAPSGLTTAVNRFRARVSQKNYFKMWLGCDDSGTGGTLHLWVSPYTDKTQPGAFIAHSYTREWLDCEAGPKCRRFDIQQNFSAHAMRVSMVFELCIPWCESTTDQMKILVNRWSVSDQIDENLFTTRTYHGTLKVANPYVNPNLFRQTVLPPLAEGMRRKSMSFDVGDDGRSLQYRIVDEEAAFAAPRPAKTWDIVHSESCGIGRPLTQTNLSIKLTADRDTSKKDLIKLANRIAQEKITGLFLINNQASGPTIKIDDLTVTDYTSNTGPVRVDLKLQATRLRDDGDAFDGAAGDIGKDLTGANFPIAGYNANLTAPPGVSGPVPFAGAVISYLRGVCYMLDGSYIRQGTPPNPAESAGAGTDPEGMPEVSTRSVSAGSITVPSWVSAQFKTAIYTHYQVDSVWDSQDARVQLPIAQSSAAYSTGADTCAIVRLGLPTTRRIIRIEASRVGSAPLIQTPLDTWTTGSGPTLMTYTRLGVKLAPTVPEKAADGQDLWIVRAEFVYACSRPPAIGEDLPIGIDPSFSGGKRSLVGTSLNTFDESSTIP